MLHLLPLYRGHTNSTVPALAEKSHFFPLPLPLSLPPPPFPSFPPLLDKNDMNRKSRKEQVRADKCGQENKMKREALTHEHVSKKELLN